MLSNNYIKIKYNENYYILFNNLELKFILVNKDICYEIENNFNKKSIDEILYRYGIYSNIDKDIKRKNRIINDYIKRERNIDTIYIIPTSNCNLRCKYCHVYKNKRKVNYNDNMTRDTANVFLTKIIKYFINKKSTNPFVQFYGGEPTLNWDVIELITKELKDKIENIEISILTNGTINLESKINFLKQYNVGVGISLDGPEVINNINRISNDNINNYRSIVNNIEKMKKENIRFAVSFTITKEVFDNKQAIFDWINELGVINLNTNFLQSMDWLEDDKINYYKSAMEFIFELNDKYKYISNDRINRKVLTFLSDYFIYSDYSAGAGSQITIRPDGNMCICQGEFLDNNAIIGNIVNDSLESIQNKSFGNTKFTSNIPIYNSRCEFCECIKICGGGCDSKRYNSEDIADCIYNKEIFRWILKKQLLIII